MVDVEQGVNGPVSETGEAEFSFEVLLPLSPTGDQFLDREAVHRATRDLNKNTITVLGSHPANAAGTMLAFECVGTIAERTAMADLGYEVRDPQQHRYNMLARGLVNG